jgi:hypothetical protein
MCLFDVYRGAAVAAEEAGAPKERVPTAVDAEMPAAPLGLSASVQTRERERAWLGAIAAVMAAAAADLGHESAVGRRLANGAAAAGLLLTGPRPALTLVPPLAEAAPARDAPAR